MLLKLAHIGFNATDINEEVENFKLNGYEEHERYENIPNPAIKRAFLTKFYPNHCLAILRKHNCANIEVVKQGLPIQQPTFIKNFYEDEYSVKLTVRTINFDESLSFWINLGCENINGSSCSLKLPLGLKPIVFYLEEDPLFKKTACLDGVGYYSLAFFCLDAKKEQSKLTAQTGYLITECADLSLSDRKITLFFLMGTQNELIEIYSIASGKRGKDESN
jgi:hypothetical protein